MCPGDTPGATQLFVFCGGSPPFGCETADGMQQHRIGGPLRIGSQFFSGVGSLVRCGRGPPEQCLFIVGGGGPALSHPPTPKGSEVPPPPPGTH